MITAWARGLTRHRTGRLLAALAGVTLAVALVAALGSFLTASKATMTQRALRSVAVDWQVQVQPGAGPNAVLSLVQKTPDTRTALPVGYAHTSGFTTRVQGSTQTTGPGVALGLPDGYRARFPDAVRTLSGSSTGVLLAQQTASNLHAAPGDTIGIQLPGAGLRRVKVDGVVDLPQADSLFQTVGAPSQSQPTAPRTTWSCCPPPGSPPSPAVPPPSPPRSTWPATAPGCPRTRPPRSPPSPVPPTTWRHAPQAPPWSATTSAPLSTPPARTPCTPRSSSSSSACQARSWRPR